jgi:hypothetical protein
MMQKPSKEEYREFLKMGLGNMPEDRFEEHLNFMYKKFETVKTGEKVIHLDYIGGTINEEELNEIQRNLSEINYELSYYDKSGIPKASAEDFALQISIILNDPTTKAVLWGVATNMIWDTIKKNAYLLWSSLRSKTYKTITSNGITNERNINFGVKIALDKNTKFDFKLEGNLSEEETLESLDKILDFLREVKVNEQNKSAEFMIFESEDRNWKRVDIQSEMIKKAKTK